MTPDQSLNLTDLANRHRSDKGTKVGTHPHRYTFLYDLLLLPFKNQPINILEMGLAVGGPEVGGPVLRRTNSPSVAMWLEYFSRAKVYGFDISDFSHLENERFEFVQGDSGNETDFLKITQKCCEFDLIIDDASHASYHQQLAFNNLFPCMRKDGLYIIEDLHWQSPFFEGKLPPVPKTGDFFDKYFLDGAHLDNSVLSLDFMKSIENKIWSYSSFPSFLSGSNMTKLIVIRASG